MKKFGHFKLPRYHYRVVHLLGYGWVGMTLISAVPLAFAWARNIKTRGQWPFRSAGKRVMMRMASDISEFAKFWDRKIYIASPLLYFLFATF